MKELCFAKICNLNAKNKKSKEKIVQNDMKSLTFQENHGIFVT